MNGNHGRSNIFTFYDSGSKCRHISENSNREGSNCTSFSSSETQLSNGITLIVMCFVVFDINSEKRFIFLLPFLRISKKSLKLPFENFEILKTIMGVSATSSHM